MEPSIVKREWTEAELMALPDVDGKYELVEGELVVSPTGFRHESMVGRLIFRLLGIARERELGEVCGSSLGCWMKNGNLRSPDVSFVSKARVEALGNAVDNFLQGAPDLAVEILSPSDSISKLKDKAVEYFESGAQLVWIVDPRHKTVTVIYPGKPERVLGMDDRLDGEDLIPGFSMPVSELCA